MLNNFKKMFYLWLILLMPYTAFAQQYGHYYYGKNRSPYENYIYGGQTVQYGNTDVKATQRFTRFFLVDEPNQDSSTYRGVTLNASVGMEHFHFIQTGVFFSSAQEADLRNDANELRSNEFGAETKFTLFSPLGNIVTGGGIYGGSLTLNNAGNKIKFLGAGYKASFEIQHFLSSKLALSVSAVQLYSKYNSDSNDSSVSALKINSLKAGIGLMVWL